MKTVLIIDPDSEMKELLKERLEAMGLHAFTAERGLDGLDAARAEIPKLIITELDLPDMSGFNFIEQIRTTQTTKSIPIIVLSGRVEAGLTERARDAGVNLFVRKPYRPKALMEGIEGILNLNEPAPMKVVHQARIYQRLVVEQLEIEVTTNDFLMRGITTGINEAGLGARINILEQIGDSTDELQPGQSCTITFRSSKYPLLPCSGSILRVETSRDPRYQRFITVKFEPDDHGGLAEGDRITLREWIDHQFDRRIGDKPGS